MSILSTLEVIQQPIMAYIIQKLQLKPDESIQEQLLKLREETADIDDLVLRFLRRLSNEVDTELSNYIQQTHALTEEYIREQWEIDEVADHREQRYQETVEYLNAYVFGGLVTYQNNTGAIVQQYLRIIDDALEAQTQAEVNEAIYREFDLGLNSGYSDRLGRVWRLDRYLVHLAKQTGVMTINSTVKDTINQYGIEVVTIPIFGDPRPACEGLQNSAGGLICIVPRNEASEFAHRLPNIWDSGHRFMQPDGHHGINCRHAWGGLGAVNDIDIFRYVDELDREIEYYRKQRYEFLKKLNME